jgi:hypothetical protein
MFTRPIVVIATILLGTACAGTSHRRSATLPSRAASDEGDASAYRVSLRRTKLAVDGAQKIYNCKQNTAHRGHGVASYADGSLLVLRYETSAEGSLALTVRMVDAAGRMIWTGRFGGVTTSNGPSFTLNVARRR